MNKLKKTLEENYLVMVIFLTLLFFVSTCSNRSAIKDIRKSHATELQSLSDSLADLSRKIKEIPTREEFQLDNEILMYEFLQFEDDIDRGKISLSELKLKLDEMRKEND